MISIIPSEWDEFLVKLKETSELVLMTKNLPKESIVKVDEDLRKREKKHNFYCNLTQT